VPIRARGDAPAVAPTVDTIRTGAYRPLSRPVFVYVSVEAFARGDVQAFIDYYLAHGGDLALEVGYVPLGDDAAGAVRARVRAGTPGSLYADGRMVARTLDERLGVR
jgi:phosphate transport system substrate-binding protein